MKDLVLKINDKCNFKCDFCSSNRIAENHEDLDIEIVKDYLLKEKVSNIIINGGDPLLVDPEYYWSLIAFISENKMDTRISLTTNLLDFWQHPFKWDVLFSHPLVDVCTSFQFGNNRKLASGKVYTAEMFAQVYKLFKEKVGKDLPFIAVITEENEDTCMKTVEFAKELDTVCRLNGCLISGRATKMYPYYKMLKVFLDIIEAGLEKYEENSRLIKRVWAGDTSECPYNKKCHETLACISPNGTIHSCPSVADDIMTKEIHPFFLEGSKAKLPFDMTMLKPECPLCPMNCFCNSCHKRLIDIKASGVEDHCKNMKKLIKRCNEVLGEPKL